MSIVIIERIFDVLCDLHLKKTTVDQKMEASGIWHAIILIMTSL